MSRLLKRVPIDFKWPLNQVWKGYISPYSGVKCRSCNGMGYSKEYNKLQERWYGNDREPEWVYLDNGRRWNRAAWNNNLDANDVASLLKADRLWDFTRNPINEEQKQIVIEKINKGENSWLPFDNGYTPTPEEVNKWNREGSGHDSSNAWYVIEAKLKKLNLPSRCEFCEGEGEFWQSDEIEKMAEKWENIEPPKGEGYQLWEDVSEGSPVSPVCKTLEDLCKWCEGNATTFGKFKASKEEWLKMLDGGHVHHKEGNHIFI